MYGLITGKAGWEDIYQVVWVPLGKYYPKFWEKQSFSLDKLQKHLGPLILLQHSMQDVIYKNLF
jgi:hypothetical protein